MVVIKGNDTAAGGHNNDGAFVTIYLYGFFSFKKCGVITINNYALI